MVAAHHACPRCGGRLVKHDAGDYVRLVCQSCDADIGLYSRLERGLIAALSGCRLHHAPRVTPGTHIVGAAA